MIKPIKYKAKRINKNNSNLVSFLIQKENISKLAPKKSEKIVSYGKKSYINKFIDYIKSDKTGTSKHWIEVLE